MFKEVYKKDFLIIQDEWKVVVEDENKDWSNAARRQFALTI